MPSSAAADQISDAKALLDTTTVSADEFARLKAKALAASAAQTRWCLARLAP